MSPGKHGPNRLRSYVDVHNNIMAQLERRGVVLSDGLAINAAGGGRFTIVGEVRCLSGVSVSVEKILEIVDGDEVNPRVQTVFYSYNARLEGDGNIFRYDSPHSEDHKPYHHKHVFDVRSGDHRGHVIEVDSENWPTLGEVLEEVEQWVFENFEWLESRD